jgi:uracil-DNA glycosylase
MDVKIEPSWKNQLSGEFSKPYFLSLVEFIKTEYRNGKVFPPGKDIFRAFEACPFDHTKVVILGQDPYHGPKQANGLAFSVKDGIPFPPSLVNIFKEIQEEYNTEMPASGDLGQWAEQGVLLLNATLTVRAHQAGSHQKKGWEIFTDAVIHRLVENKEHLVFLLWGSYAQKKASFIDPEKHCVLKSPHPSPLSAHRGFFGNGHFQKANAYLKQQGMEPIQW